MLLYNLAQGLGKFGLYICLNVKTFWSLCQRGLSSLTFQMLKMKKNSKSFPLTRLNIYLSNFFVQI